MTDTKRPNLGKASVATPNIGPSGMVSLENALSGAIGARSVLSLSEHIHWSLCFSSFERIHKDADLVLSEQVADRKL